MKRSIIRTLSATQVALRAAVITSVSLALFFLAACDVNAPSDQRNANAISGSQGQKSLSLTSAVSLGSASTFAVIGYAGVTNADSSFINGDLGAGPGAPSATGFDLVNNTIVYGAGGTVTTGLGIVTGTIYAGGPVELQAYNDAVVAYNYLIGLTPDTTYSGDGYQIDGMTFTPGVYRFAPSANLRVNGTVYLDFQGNNDALFVFQFGTTLVTMADSKVIALHNDSLTCTGSNVYWAVGSSATIDGAQFLGTVIANTTITMTSAANTPPDANTAPRSNVFGRMFALGASVTMVNSTIEICGSAGGVVPPPKPCRDFVTGGGWIDGIFDGKGHKGDNSKATFGVSGGIKNDKFWGQLSFNDHNKKNGVKVKSTSVTGYRAIDLVTREIKGIAKVNGKGSFTYVVVVVDNGEPGRNDAFSLEVSNGYSYSVSGTLKGGNIQLHRKCGELRDHHDNGGKENYDDKDERDGNNNCDKD